MLGDEGCWAVERARKDKEDIQERIIGDNAWSNDAEKMMKDARKM